MTHVSVELLWRKYFFSYCNCLPLMCNFIEAFLSFWDRTDLVSIGIGDNTLTTTNCCEEASFVKLTHGYQRVSNFGSIESTFKMQRCGFRSIRHFDNKLSLANRVESLLIRGSEPFRWDINVVLELFTKRGNVVCASGIVKIHMVSRFRGICGYKGFT